jgi:peptidoglycan/xylan/chitin deacetylase (PgdA/CDA1 family)
LRGAGNWLFLKYLPGFRAWGPYREMNGNDWDSVFRILSGHDAKLTVAITGAWVEKDASLVAFPDKFPEEAAKLKEGLRSGLVEIANHGLTHCVLEGRRFLPKPFSSNRKDHREFWDWLPESTHHDHLRRSQDILQGFFGVPVTTLVPPGNVFSDGTMRAAVKVGIERVNCNTAGRSHPGLKIIGNEEVFAFHDRELVLFGTKWLEARLKAMPADTRYVFAKDL